MQTPYFQQRLAAYRQWKSRVTRAVLEFEHWLENEGQASPDTRERIRSALAALEKDRITIAFAAESSRGKTELINAVFFSEYHRPLLPSSGTGRAHSCPTELLWDDERNEAYLRLLPIETRAQDIPISQLKTDPKQWVHYPLHMQDAEHLAAAFGEIGQGKRVSIAEATRLGLSTFDLTREGQPAAHEVEIPKWRHAIISFPHPLLKQGLVIVNTPGRISLGSEPELTLGMLPGAQALVFVLAADRGVTRSDLEIWQHHLKGFQSQRQRSIMVALNKIDLLWDEEKATQAAEASVAKQRANAAETLGIGEELVLAVSAQKGGLAKAQKDEALLQSSGLPALERVVSARMLETKHRTLLDRLQADVGGLLEDNRSRLGARINQVKDQLSELEALREKSGAVIAHLLEKTRREQELYLEGVRAYQASREELIAEAQLGRQILEKDRIDALIRSAHRDMIHSWTTYGLAAAMKTLSDELRRSVQSVGSECERLRRLVRVTFQRFEEELGFSVPLPKVFVPVKFHVETELLCQDVNAFRKNPAILFREQGRVIRRFDQQIVSRAQLLFDQLRVAFDGWLRDALQPLAEQIQQHKHMMEKRLENLQRIGRSKDGLQSRIDDAQRQYVELAKQLTALRNIHNALHFDPTVDEKHSGRPRLVASGV